MSSIMNSFTASTALIILFAMSRVAAFSGSFKITDLYISSPFQANVTSVENSTVSFVFNDQNTPKLPPVSCCATWAIGLSPPSEPVIDTCSNDSVHVSFPTGTYNGVADLFIQISHTFEDDSIGQPPYNILSLFGGLNLTYGEYGNGSTPNYDCDLSQATCHSSHDATLIAKITSAVA